MSDKITAYPLSWPPAWPRTEGFRDGAKFKTTLPSALNNVRRQIELMGGKNVVLSSNYTLGNDNPKDPAVVAYFTWDGTQLAIPCDRWSRLESNLQAIALTVEAMRGMERWGAKHMIRAMFTGFKQLGTGVNRKPWWKVLGVDHGDLEVVVREAYRTLAKQHHPDAGGNAERFLEIQMAWEESGYK
jgi:hypothetical protein